MPGFGEQEEADLQDVGARADVDEVVLGIRVEGIAFGEVVEAGVDLLEVPGIGQIEDVPAHVGLGRCLLDVLGHEFRQALEGRAVDQLEAVHDEIRLLAGSHRRPPPVPASRPEASVLVQLGAEQADDDSGAVHAVSKFIKFICQDRYLLAQETATKITCREINRLPSEASLAQNMLC